MSKTLLDDSLSGNHDKLEVRLKSMTPIHISKNLKLQGHFYYLPFRNHQATVDEFVDFLFHRIAHFCIPAKELKKAFKKSQDENDARYTGELLEKAKNLFLQGREQKKTSGEPGELVLFSILEGKLKAPIVVSKMYLKTNTSMPVHGTDGIHVLWDEERKDIVLLWGEVKIYKSFSKAVTSLCASITKFISDEEKRSPKQRDIEIIQDHISIENEELKTLILKKFDPYDESSNTRNEAYACLIGFDYEPLKKCKSQADEDIFLENYQNWLVKAVANVEEKITTSKIHQLEYHLFLVPFSCVAEFRKKFFTRLGVSGD